MTTKERKAKATAYHEAHPGSCWAGLVHWSFDDEETDTIEESADPETCIEESKHAIHGFSCWCGQYKNGKLMPKIEHLTLPK